MDLKTIVSELLWTLPTKAMRDPLRDARLLPAEVALLRETNRHCPPWQIGDNWDRLLVAELIVSRLAGVNGRELVWDAGFEETGPALLELGRLQDIERRLLLRFADEHSLGLTRLAATALLIVGSIESARANPETTAYRLVRKLQDAGAQRCRWRDPASSRQWSERLAARQLILDVQLLRTPGAGDSINGVSLFVPGFQNIWPLPPVLGSYLLELFGADLPVAA